MEKIIEPILTALTLGIVGVILAIIKSVGDVTIQYIAKKKEMVEQKLKLDQHEEEIKTAKQIWNIVEEKYRITDNIKDLAKSKADYFDKLLLEKIPYLTEEQVKMLRQAIAGEVNKGKKQLFEDSLKQQATQLVEENEKLKLLNAETENKLAAVKSLNESL
ncbi:cobalt ABC transporter permease [Clostridium perfringens]|uniref:Cobalt ABC transporter permease n=4 Tax=Clostridium perfringens TaxID=1502 RepID=A0AAN5SG13_CLOPF|nr:cobalt ABC transporter permease [Clostridium perfringens]AQW28524.1 cobalt ABC transporter permease [Clostridium perfringens]MBO3322890.1 cobalt ABC transporter permease [Clostridium perfringens]MBO3332054.1 cobalt ABC transporter permease [Clostridium perfringens]MBO3408102.1 cobalt ABC transporter permease [Clostridium perfringens]MDC4245301.1 cobalt ABC transporter permease [Clostridium perfringens]